MAKVMVVDLDVKQRLQALARTPSIRYVPELGQRLLRQARETR